jgi:flavin reductase (DIM6/NTAB) family NADH-FMN oxidoreductase RutF
VNVLTSGQQDLSNQYAKKGDHTLDPDHYEIGVTGVPVMPATSVSFECELETTYPGGDHVILIGRVVEMADRDHGEPLLFCSGSYRELK